MKVGKKTKEKKEAFYILGYRLEFIIKIWPFEKIKILPNLANLVFFFFL
jgi:hypothetical protein